MFLISPKSDCHLSLLSCRPPLKFCFLLWVTFEWKYDVFLLPALSQLILALCFQNFSSFKISPINSCSIVRMWFASHRVEVLEELFCFSERRRGVQQNGSMIWATVFKMLHKKVRNFNLVTSDFAPRVSMDMNRSLTAPLSLEEVKHAVFSINPKKAPGEDGFTSFFFSKILGDSWDRDF